VAGAWKGAIERVDEYRWRIPESYKRGMRVPGVVYADGEMMSAIAEDQSLEQVANVATLPGIVERAMAMPDIHWGYGFPIGGVAATDVDRGGVISPGGVGYDINCGVRLLTSGLPLDEAAPRLARLADAIFANVPAGVGSKGSIRLSARDLKRVLEQGAAWAVERGYGDASDLEHIEERGCMREARADAVGAKAVKRGADQLGTLGAGNHFVEVGVVRELYDEAVAARFGLCVGEITILLHTGSRGLGHQVCTDYVRVAGEATRKYGIDLPDRQLACAPLSSPEGRDYFCAMAAASNFAWANRQCLTHHVRDAFASVYGREARLDVVYDQAHNIAKLESHTVGGAEVRLCVHRKGAARAFPAGRPEIPETFRDVGHPVLVPGDMGSESFVMVGTAQGLAETFGSACHGAGRVMSRGAAKRSINGADLRRSLESRGIHVRCRSNASLAEEAPDAYKDVTRVVDVTHRSGIARKVARLEPLAVMKG